MTQTDSTAHLRDLEQHEIEQVIDMLSPERVANNANLEAAREAWTMALGERASALIRLQRAETDMLSIATRLGVREHA